MSKTAVKPVKSEWQPLARQDGSTGHNVEWNENADYIAIRFSKSSATIQSKNGNPILATSRGFAPIAGSFSLSLNLMDKRKN